MSAGILIATYCVLIALAALAGGMLPSLIRLTHTRMQVLMSFLGGIMMGVAILHLLPHAALESGSYDTAAMACMVGLLATMLMVRWFHFHQHEMPSGEGGHAHDHDHDHDRDPEHEHAPTTQCGDAQVTSRFGWVGLFIGLSVHTLMDGLALAASVAGHTHDGDETAGLAGLGTFLAIALHKPLDALSITFLMKAGGWRATGQRTVCFLYALLCPLGAIAFYEGLQGLAEGRTLIIGWALGLSAGIFLCIALVDVLPEVQFHRHDRVKLSIALLLGVLTAWGIGLVEPEHAHEVRPANAVKASE